MNMIAVIPRGNYVSAIRDVQTHPLNLTIYSVPNFIDAYRKTHIDVKDMPWAATVLYSLLKSCDDIQFSPIQFINREDAEKNPNFLQLVVGCFIHSETRFVLMDCVEGDMKGNFTIVEGHCDVYRRPSDSEELFVFEYMYNELMREFFEELSITISPKGMEYILTAQHLAKFCRGIPERPMISPMWISCAKFDIDDPDNISKYHIGFIYDLHIPDKLLDEMTIVSKESKNRVVIMDKGAITSTGNIDKCDPWTKELVRIWL